MTFISSQKWHIPGLLGHTDREKKNGVERTPHNLHTAINGATVSPGQPAIFKKEESEDYWCPGIFFIMPG